MMNEKDWKMLYEENCEFWNNIQELNVWRKLWVLEQHSRA